MSWAARRRFLILFLLGAVVLAIAAVTLIATVHHTPSCSDGIQNRDEQGIDCGGTYCTYLCAMNMEPPTVLFTKPIGNGSGRTDVVAEIENKNATAAAKNVPYTMQLFDASHTLVQSVSGTVDLPPAATVPLYIHGVASGNQVVASAFLSIDPTQVLWYRLRVDPRILPKVSNTTEQAVTDTPTIRATLTNPSTVPLSQVLTIIFVRNGQGNIIAASQTIVPTIPALGTAPATFTWNAAFSEPAVTTEVIPVIPLP